MSFSIKASHIAQVSGILDFVHDCAFDLSSVNFDHTLQRVTITIGVRTREIQKFFGVNLERYGMENAKLHINNATKVRFEDMANIGEGDIGSIEYSDNQIRLLGNIPVNVFIDVDNLDIELILPERAALA